MRPKTPFRPKCCYRSFDGYLMFADGKKGSGAVRRAVARMEFAVASGDVSKPELTQAVALEAKIERVIEYFRHFDQARCKTGELVDVVSAFAECVRSLDLSDYADDIEDIAAVLIGFLPRAEPELGRVIIHALLGLSYQEFEPFLHSVSSEIYMGLTNCVLSSPWREEFASDLYMALYRMATKSLRIRNAVIVYMPIERLASLIRESDTDISAKCYLLYALSSQRLSDEEARVCVKVIHFLFEHAHQSVLQIVTYAMFNVMRKCSEVPSCFFSDDTLALMVSRAEGDDRVSEYLLYVINEALTKQNAKKMNVNAETIVSFLSSNDPKCQMAAVCCVRTMVKSRRTLIPREGVGNILALIESHYMNTSAEAKAEFNKLIIDIFKTMFDEASAVDFIMSNYVHVIVEMLQSVLSDSRNKATPVLIFYRELFDAAAKVAVIGPLSDAFEEHGVFATLKEIFMETPADEAATRSIIDGILTEYGR